MISADHGDADLLIGVGAIILTPVKLQTTLYEVTDMWNKRPLGVNKTPNANGTYKVLTPNCLLMWRSLEKGPDDTHFAKHLKKSEKYQLI